MNRDQMVIRADARAMGAVTALDTRVSERWTATKGAARFTDTTIDGVYVPAAVRASLVKVTHKDGTTQYRSASSFRSKHISTRSTVKRATMSATEKTRFTDHASLIAGLAPIGNVE